MLENILKEKQKLADEEKVKKLQERLEKVKVDDKESNRVLDSETIKPLTSPEPSLKGIS